MAILIQRPATWKPTGEGKKMRILALTIGLIGAVGAAWPVAAEPVTTGASLSVARPDNSGAPVVRGTRRDSVDNEVFTAGPNETAEVVFADGSSLTLASSASVLVERFHYDRATRLGELSARVQTGLVRVIGGVLNNTNMMHISTPQGEVQIDNGIATVAVEGSGSQVALLLGKSIAVNSSGKQVTLTRAGTAVHMSNGELDSPSTLDLSHQTQMIASLNPGLLSGVAPTFLADNANAGEQPNGSNVEQTQETVRDERAPGTVTNSGGSGGPGGGTTPPPVELPLADPSSIGNIGSACSTCTAQNQLNWGAGSSTPVNLVDTGVGGAVNDWSFELGSSPKSTSVMFSGGGFSTVLAASGQPATVLGTGGDVTYLTPQVCDQVTTLCGGHEKLSDAQYNFYDTAALFAAPNGKSVFGIGDPSGSFATWIFQAPKPQASDQLTFGTSTSAQNAFGVNAVTADIWAGIAYKSYVFTLVGNPTVDVNNNNVCTSGTLITANNTPGCFTLQNSSTDTTNPCPAGSGQTACMTTFIGTALLQNPSVALNIGQENGPFTIPYRDPDNNFFAFDARAQDPAHAANKNAYFYASGQVLRSSTSKAATTLDIYLLSNGLVDYQSDANYQAAVNACATTGVCLQSGTRAFLRNETIPVSGGSPISIADSGLLVLNPAGSNTSALFHADFGLSGSGADQVSTISTYLGTLTYNDAQKSAAAAGLLVGSTYGPGRNPDGTTSTGGTPNAPGLTAISTSIASTAAGGGSTNPKLTSDGNTRAEYLVLQTCNATDPACKSLEHPVHSTDSDVGFASLRLASGAATISPGTRSDNASTGYLAGLQESSTDGSVTFLSPLLTSDTRKNQADPNLTLTTSTTANTVSADITGLTSATALHLGAPSTTDNTTGQSAYIDDARFGAETVDGRTALISGPSVISATDAQSGWKASADGSTTAGMTADLQKTVTSYKYLQWGFFFGDATSTRSSDAYAHLASWVSGKITDPSKDPGQLGTATYSGHVLGNVSTGSSMYTAIGTFSNTWDFAVRQGTVAMNFDQASYTGKTNFVGDKYDTTAQKFQNPTGPNNNSSFVGTVATADSSRQGVLNGAFISDPNSTATHVGEIGRFDIVGTTSGKVSYVASGTFAAERPH